MEWSIYRNTQLYPKIRPKELINIQEGHINTEENWIVFPHQREGEAKFVHVLPMHIDLIEENWNPRGLTHLYFFRHITSRSGIKVGLSFGERYLRKWWQKACENIGIQGVTLYPRTKHTTVTALGKLLAPEQIQRGGNGHASDAFKRYMLPDINEASIVTEAINTLQNKKSDKVLNFYKKAENEK